MATCHPNPTTMTCVPILKSSIVSAEAPPVAWRTKAMMSAVTKANGVGAWGDAGDRLAIHDDNAGGAEVVCRAEE